MDKTIVILILSANLLSTNCQEGENVEDKIGETSDTGISSYSYSYGVQDGRTGDVKTVWESRNGDTVKGHYSVVQPDGSKSSVKYSTGPKTDFQEDFQSEEIEDRSSKKEKTIRDYDRYYDFSEDAEEEEYYEREREKKRTKRPYESTYSQYSNKKRLKYPSYSDQPLDSEPSDYTHSITIKHPHDDSSEIEPQSHVGYSFDPNCKTKTRKESYGSKIHSYANYVDMELNKKYPQYPTDSYRDNYDKFAAPTFEYDKYVKHHDGGHYKGHRYEDTKPGPAKYTFPLMPDAPPSDKYYPDEIPTRPKKKRPYKYREPEQRYPTVSEDLSEYVLVPKKKSKKPKPVVESYDYRTTGDEYDRPHYSSGYDDFPDDNRYNSENGQKEVEVVRKVVKKRKPVINLLDMFDI
ncbi:uncharacterized protein LOC142973109 [Anticarsia gemmatalis]|uniref:uncharacterized protein LOC142973109 n=1 Tax=Anticarsia gemmatalis TaxID=129554 RepID=UPI003F7615C9